MSAFAVATAVLCGILALCLAYIGALVLLSPRRLHPPVLGLNPYGGGWRRLAVIGAGVAWVLIIGMGTHELLGWIPYSWEIPVGFGGDDGTTWAPLRFVLSTVAALALGKRSIDAIRADTAARADDELERRPRIG